MENKSLIRFKNLILKGDVRSVIVKKNILGSFAIKGIGIVISLILVPLTLGYLNKEMYGIWLTLASITLWLNFFDIGFTLGLKNKLTEAISTGNFEHGRYLVSTTYVMLLLIFIPLGIILEICIPLIDWSGFLNVASEYNSAIQKAMYALIAIVCIQMVVNVITAVVAAFQKVALSSAFPVIGQFISLIIIFLLTKLDHPTFLAMVFAISSMPVIVMIIGSLILYRGRFKAIAPSFRYFKKEYIKELFNLGIRFFIIQIQMVVLFQMTNILISNISGPIAVSQYNIAYKYLDITQMILVIVTGAFWPAFTDAYTKLDYIWMKNIYNKLLKMGLAVCIIMLLMVAISPVIYNIWIGKQIEISFILTLLIAVHFIIQTFNSINANLINGVGHVKLQSYMAIIGLVIHIPLSLFLGKYIGVLGVVVSLIIIRSINLPIYFIQTNKILNKKTYGIWGK